MRRLVAQAGGPTEWARRFGGDRWSQAQASQWISETKPKGIGGNLARDLEAAMGLDHGELDRPPSAASQPLKPDQAKFDAATRFFEQLEQSRPDLVITDATRLFIVASVYAELVTTPTPNLVEMTVRYSKMLEEAA